MLGLEALIGCKYIAMGKRGSGGDAKKLAELQASLKEKAEAEKAALTNMDPPPVPEKKKKTRDSSSPSEPPSSESSPTPTPTEPPAAAAKSSSKKRSGGDGDESRPKAKAKSGAKKRVDEPIDFEITWDNHALLMKHFGITEDEATQCLLAVVGQDPKARKFWEKFVVKKPEEPAEPTEQEIASTPKSPPVALDPPQG